jgi:hypothetical protein
MTRVALAGLATAAAALTALPVAAIAADLKVATTDAKDIGPFGATLHADVDHAVDGGEVAWQYGTTKAYGATTLALTLAAQDARQQPSLPLSCLTPGVTYHVRAVASSGLTTVYGADKTFKTTAASGTGGAPAGCDTGAGAGGGAGSGTPGTGTTTTPATTTTTGSTSTPSGTTTTTTSTAGEAAPLPITPTDSATPSGNLGGTDGSGATQPPGAATQTVAPVLGRTVAAAAVTGRVTATSPSGKVLDLATATSIPTGTVIDTRAGAVELKTAVTGDRPVQVARFWGGRFEVRQSAASKGLTQLVLRGGDFSGCAATAGTATARAAAATKRKPKPRALWGSDDHGRFQTRGRGSVATVRGTRWLTQDTCAGTRTRVVAGAVAVRDLRRHRTVVVRRGHEYLARVAR